MMTKNVLCDVEFGSRCFSILAREVGPVDAERFIAYVNRERIDYTKWQQTLFAGQTIEEIAAAARTTAMHVRRERAKT